MCIVLHCIVICNVYMCIYIYINDAESIQVLGTGHLAIAGLPTEVERSSSERFAESEQKFWSQT